MQFGMLLMQECNDPQTAWQHIKLMVVRGAPAIGDGPAGQPAGCLHGQHAASLHAAGVTGALAMAVDLVANKGAGAAFGNVAECMTYVNTTLDYLVTRFEQQHQPAAPACASPLYLPLECSRPTAVNLADAAIQLKAAAASAAAAAAATPQSLVHAVVAAAEAYLAADLKCNEVLCRQLDGV